MIDFLNKFRCLGRRYPSCPESFFFHTAEIQHLGKNSNPFFSGIITIQVIAFAQVSATHKNAVHTLLKRPEHMMGRHAPGTHDTDNPDICRVLHTTDPSQVSSGIGSPGAQKTNNMGFKISVVHSFLSLYKLKRFLSLFIPGDSPVQAAPICARSCSGLNPRSWALWDGQVAAQFPHPLQRISFILQIRSSGLWVMAS